ncbi:MAG: response regulator [Planctomycetota bacterium JB042]
MTELRVLVIDDEELVRDVLARLLRRLGAEVVSEADGEGGVARYAEAMSDGRRFDAVLVDLTISGGRDGKEVVSELLGVDPDCRAIVCSGYSNDPALVDHARFGFRSRITKPFRMADLRRALWEATGRGGEGDGAN